MNKTVTMIDLNYFKVVFWTLICGWKGPINQGMSVCLPSFHLEVFLGLAHYFFSETQHGNRGPCGVVCRPWHDVWAIACARAVTHTNQEKGGLGGQ